MSHRILINKYIRRFLVYIDDIGNDFLSRAHLFQSDTNLYFSNMDIEQINR